jgi:RNA recognition motif-containing protein
MKIFVGNISYDVSTQEIRDALSEFGTILDIHRPNDRETGKPRGFAFVTYASEEEGRKAMEEISGLKLGGRELRADEAEESTRPTHQTERRRQVTMDVEVERVDDRPIAADGKRVRYKGI